MRKAVENLYKGPRWKLEVESMSDRQIAAIYKDAKERGKFDTDTAEGFRKQKLFEEPKCEQVNIWNMDIVEKTEQLRKRNTENGG